MLIRAFGLFWERDEVDWKPGSGRALRLLGRRGWNRPGLRVVDFRPQQGLYVLYGNYGPYYVGLTKRQGLGKRLQDHARGLIPAAGWQRFSWFGFCRPLKQQDPRGLHRLSALAETGAGSPSAVISDTEALLIKALGLPSNIRSMSFKKADEWHQVKLHEHSALLSKVAE